MAGVSLFKSEEGRERYLKAYNAALRLWPVDFQEMDLPTRYGSTHVLVCGPERAPSLVLLHGARTSSTMWYANIAGLCQNFRVYAIDSICEQGKSVPEKRIPTVQEYAVWLKDVLNQLHLSQVYLAGLSGGGFLAATFAIYRPERVKKLVLISPTGVFIRPSNRLRISHEVVTRLPLSPLILAELRKYVTPGFNLPSLFCKQFVIGMQERHWPDPGAAPVCFEDETLHDLRQPVLLLVGDQDRVNPPEVLEWARERVPGIVGDVVPDSGHFAALNQPDWVNDRVAAFLS